ncbi:MAG: KEOPS complex subunit Cgi121, partial [Candidatus Bathyarchaeota archaeon]|nr:KEOPS complex subunit Cgi121 [Candidatus Bathyarchaeota archaeon]
KNFGVLNYKEICSKIDKGYDNLEIQFVDPRKILGSNHIYFATLNALKAFKNEKNISKSLSIEILLYISGQKQIEVAIRLFGLQKKNRNLILIAVGEKKEDLKRFEQNVKKSLNVELNNSIIESYSKKKYDNIKRVFNISTLEIETIKRKSDDSKDILEKLIVERMAFLYAGIEK